ncbi:hypothetical protein [Streptosporangium sp. KLBMP 9127]|nr:hypothetical protein [Streptosporangium sp. KLBMP 9127]
MPKIPLALALAVALLGLLTACGNTATQAGREPSPTGQEPERRIETMIADCMKEQGFKYVPYVEPFFEGTDESRRRSNGDYEAIKRFREKNGYGIYAIYVYPQEFHNPMVEPDETAKPKVVNPNFKIRSSLSKTQTLAYEDAHDRCYVKAVKKVLGKDVKSMMDRFEQADARAKQLVARELDGEPRLAELAAAMGSCLKAKGYTIGSTKPTAMAGRGPKRFNDEKAPLGEKIPEDTRKRLEQPEGARYEPDLNADQARPYLAREIKDALDDLECGKEFYLAFLPAELSVQQRAYREFGMGFRN